MDDGTRPLSFWDMTYFLLLIWTVVEASTFMGMKLNARGEKEKCFTVHACL
jgi:hypothetical protein